MLYDCQLLPTHDTLSCSIKVVDDFKDFLIGHSCSITLLGMGAQQQKGYTTKKKNICHGIKNPNKYENGQKKRRLSRQQQKKRKKSTNN